MTRFISLLSLAFVLLAAPLVGNADGFGINATRLIYPQGEKSISVTLRNTLEHTPYLVQAALSAKQDVQVSAPFVVTPPLFRLEAKSTNQLRIAFTGAPLPADRESVFYLHATAIPASPGQNAAPARNDIQAQLRFGVGSIIKVFYRPSHLTGSSSHAQRDLQFSQEAHGLKVTNASPYFVSLNQLKAGGYKLPLDTSAARMIAPFSSYTWPLKTALAAKSQIQWKTINDSGGIDAFHIELP